MTFKEYLFLKRVLGNKPMGFSYIKDQYALQLLQYQTEKYQLCDGAKISEIKKWDLGFLTGKSPSRNWRLVRETT